MKKTRLPYKIFLSLFAIFLAGWLIGVLTAPMFPAPTSASLAGGVTVDVSSSTPTLSLWQRFTNSFLDLWFSIPDAIRGRRPAYNYSTNFPPGIAKVLQESCQQNKQALQASIERQITGGELGRQQTKALWKKMVAEAIKTMQNSFQQYITTQREAGQYVNEASFQRYIEEYQRIIADIDAAGDAGWQAANESLRSLPDRLPC